MVAYSSEVTFLSGHYSMFLKECSDWWKIHGWCHSDVSFLIGHYSQRSVLIGRKSMDGGIVTSAF